MSNVQNASLVGRGWGDLGNSATGEPLTITVLVLFKRSASLRQEEPLIEIERGTYEEGEGLLELRNLLLGERVGL